jgi:hypothetical protein
MNKKLKKFALSLLVVAGFATAATAQTYQKGNSLLNLGVGFGGGFGTPIGASYEYGFTDNISGGIAGTYSSSSTPFIGGKITTSWINIAARASYHLDLSVENLDVYAGPQLGYSVASVKSTGGLGNLAAAGGMIYGGFAGARYMFSKSIGIYAEGGYGVATFNGGLALKF